MEAPSWKVPNSAFFVIIGGGLFIHCITLDSAIVVVGYLQRAYSIADFFKSQISGFYLYTILQIK